MRHLSNSFHRFAIAGLAFGLPVLAVSTSAQTMNEDIKLLAIDGTADDQFGSSVAVDGGVVAVGSPQDSVNGTDSGSAYLFNVVTGTQLFKLLPNDGASGDLFGSSVAMGGGLVVVGARDNDERGLNAGAVYVFDATTGAQLAKLLADDADAGDLFGASVAIDSGVIAIGAMRDNDNGTDSGSAYLFDAATFAQFDKLLADDGAAIDLFGESIDIDGGIVAVGAHGNDEANLDAGAAYLFDVSSGNQIHKLMASNPARNDFFGAAISIDDGVVAVGAWAKSIFFDHSGSAYLFDAKTGAQIGSPIVPADGHDRAHFGISISIDNGVVVIGADQDRDNGFNAGAAYMYDASNGDPIDKLLASDGTALDLLGTSVAIQKGVIAAGAIGESDSGDFAGAAYVFGTTGVNCPADTNHDGVLTPTDFTAWIDAFNNASPECDQNDDTSCDPTDFTAWIVNYNAGC